MQNGDTDSFQIIEERTIPDVYADSVRFELSIYGVTLEFGQTQKQHPGNQGPTPHVPKLRVHMSPQHAKIMAKLFAKNMQKYEEELGTLPLPSELYRELDIKEDW